MIPYILLCIVESRSITLDYMERRSFLHKTHVASEIFVAIRRDPSLFAWRQIREIAQVWAPLCVILRCRGVAKANAVG